MFGALLVVVLLLGPVVLLCTNAIEVSAILCSGRRRAEERPDSADQGTIEEDDVEFAVGDSIGALSNGKSDDEFYGKKSKEKDSSIEVDTSRVSSQVARVPKQAPLSPGSGDPSAVVRPKAGSASVSTKSPHSSRHDPAPNKKSESLNAAPTVETSPESSTSRGLKVLTGATVPENSSQLTLGALPSVGSTI